MIIKKGEEEGIEGQYWCGFTFLTSTVMHPWCPCSGGMKVLLKTGQIYKGSSLDVSEDRDGP